MSDTEYQCSSCGELFPIAVWHCNACGHHHGPDRCKCSNCYMARRRSPLATPLTSADAEMWLSFRMLCHIGQDDVLKIEKYARAARPAQLGKRLVKQVLFLAELERKRKAEF